MVKGKEETLDIVRALSSGDFSKIDPTLWPAQRRFLSWWMKQFNDSLFQSRKQIGKAIILRVVGKKDEDILKHDKVEPQELLIKIDALDRKEVSDLVMNKLKGLK